MSHLHLQLFPSSPFLENKLGSERFADIPQLPGIYRFYDADDSLLYVGKAKNLRRRLFTYKRASPGKTTRKEAALIRNIYRFEYDVLDSEKEALLAENRWIRERRPEYNHQNKHIETYYYIILYRTSCGFGLEYSMKPSVPLIHLQSNFESPSFLKKTEFAIQSARIFGCFKGHRRVRTHLGDLLRLICFTKNRITNSSFLPPQLTRNLAPKRYFFQQETNHTVANDELHAMLIHWFTGHSPDLVYFLIQHLSGNTFRFQQAYICAIISNLLSYYDHTLLTYGSFISDKEKQGRPGFIFQDELDDLQVRHRSDWS